MLFLECSTGLAIRFDSTSLGVTGLGNTDLIQHSLITSATSSDINQDHPQYSVFCKNHAILEFSNLETQLPNLLATGKEPKGLVLAKTLSFKNTIYAVHVH